MRPSATIRSRARELRQQETPAERLMWGLLRDHRLEGLKFRRQYPIGTFVADFCCRKRRLIVELDGDVHDTDPQRARDENRDTYLRQQGFQILRFRNEALFNDPDLILQRIFEALR